VSRQLVSPRTAGAEERADSADKRPEKWGNRPIRNVRLATTIAGYEAADRSSGGDDVGRGGDWVQ
jgi:hypothetical protein